MINPELKITQIQAILNCSREAFSLLNEKFQPIYRTHSVEILTGCSYGESKNNEGLDKIHPDDLDMVKKIREKVLKNPCKPISVTFRTLHKNGNYIWLRSVMTNLLHDKNVCGIVSNYENITTQKENEKEQMLFASLVNSSDDVILSKNLDGIITAWNKSAEKEFGYTSKFIIGKHISILIPADLQYEEADIMKKIRNGQGVDHYETKRLTKSGSIIHVYLTIFPIKDSLGNVTGAYKILRNITQRKKTEEKLIYANRMYAFLSQINQTIVYAENEKIVFKKACLIATELGKFKAAWIGIVNKETKTINLIEEAGISPHDLEKFSNASYENNGPQYHVLQKDASFVCNDIQNDLELCAWKMFAKQKGYGSAMILPIRKNGIIIATFNLYATEIDFFSETEIALLEEAVRDISFSLEIFEKEKLHKSAEEKMIAIENRYRQIVETAHEGIWMLDVDNKTSFVNKKMTDMLGYRVEEMLGKSNFYFMDDASKQEALRTLERRKQGLNDNVELRFTTKSGKSIWTHMSASPVFGAQGEYLGALGMFSDITERKKVEEEIKHSEANLTAIIENSDASIYSLDTNFRYITFNTILKNSIQQAYGLNIKPGDLVFGFLEKLNPSEATDWKNKYTEALKGKSIKFEKEFVVQGFQSFISFSINPIIKNDKIIGLSCFARDITQQKISEQKIVNSEKHIRNFANHLNQLLEEERAHLAREIHDELGQQLVGIKIGISALGGKNNNTINDLLKDVNNTIQSVRKIATELRPGILDSLGLIPSIEWLVKGFEKKTGIKCNIFLNVEEQWFEKDLCTCFFRIGQEALTNITKHAGANEVIVEMNYINDILVMEITDNGKGIANEKLENPFSVGLLGMKERVKIIGGNLKITSKQNEGTTVVLLVKIKQ